jgi:CheY-like chemotaxis protein
MFPPGDCVITKKERPRRLRILVADDNVDQCTTLKLLLEAEGYEVRCVWDGTGALEVAPEFQPDACVLDLAMPGRSGFDVAAEIRTRYGDRRPYLIAMSGEYDTQQLAGRLKAVGFDKYFQKPAYVGDLYEVLRALTENPSGTEPHG